MPFSSNLNELKSTLSGSRNFWIFFSGCVAPMVFILVLVFYQTKHRFNPPDPLQEIDEVVESKEDTVKSADTSQPIGKNVQGLSAKKDLPKEKPYDQVNAKQALDAFDDWVGAFQEINRHDPRQLLHFYQKGVKLSYARARAFKKLIQNDPELALKRALPREIIHKFPEKIRENLEEWEEGYGDILTHYGCKGEDHQKCEEVNNLVLDNENLQAHFYGKRNHIGGLNGAAFYGVRMGKQIAIAENPFRDLQNEQSTLRGLSLGGQEISFKSEAEKDLFVEMVEIAEMRARSTMTTVKYPVMAGSNGVTVFLEKRYEIVTTPTSWAAAHADASTRRGRLLCIGSAAENAYVMQLLSSANLGGATQVWIGLTDNPLQDGSILNKETNNTQTITINASNGDWKWLSGDDVSGGFTHWANSQEPNSTEFSYASLQLNTGHWNEDNESLTLPYIIEYDNGFEPRTNIAPIDGFRKVLVIPVRFRDEGHIYNNANFPLVDNLGNPLFPGLQQDSFEPITQEDLAKTMEEVRQFYLRNSDGTFNLQPVITPTVTIDYDKYDQSRSVNFDSLQFDATNELIGSIENTDSTTDILGGHGLNALYKVARN